MSSLNCNLTTPSLVSFSVKHRVISANFWSHHYIYMGSQTIDTLEGKGLVLTRPSTISKGHWAEPPTLTITKVQNRWRKQWQKFKRQSRYMHTCREPIRPSTRVVVITNYSLSPWLRSARFSVLDTTLQHTPTCLFLFAFLFFFCALLYISHCVPCICFVFHSSSVCIQPSRTRRRTRTERERERERERPSLIQAWREEKKKVKWICRVS